MKEPRLIPYPINTIKCFCFLFLVSCSNDAEHKNGNGPDSERQIPKVEESVQEMGLKEINPEIFIGANIIPSFDDEKYMAIHKKEFNANQALFYAGFGGWPEPESLSLENFNTVVNWMRDNKVSLMYICW